MVVFVTTLVVGASLPFEQATPSSNPGTSETSDRNRTRMPDPRLVAATIRGVPGAGKVRATQARVARRRCTGRLFEVPSAGMQRQPAACQNADRAWLARSERKVVVGFHAARELFEVP